MLGLSITAAVIGTLLLIIECFLPGLGIAGISGIILSILGIVGLAQFMGVYVLFVVLLIVAIVITVITVFAKSAHSGKNPLVLSTKADKESGFSANEDCSELINKSGEAITGLRPAGIALIEGERYDVVTDGDFIEVGEQVFVTQVQGRRIIVKKQ
jgi:membrane-bound serine protease (ClpP class)